MVSVIDTNLKRGLGQYMIIIDDVLNARYSLTRI